MKNPLRTVKLVYCKSTSLTKLVVLVTVVLSIAALLVLSGAVQASLEKWEELRVQAIALEQDNSRLEQYIEQLGTVEGIIRIAQEKLGLVEPGTILIQPE